MSNQKQHYRTYQIWIHPGHRLFSYFQQTCLHTKNLYNTTNFYIRQIYTALGRQEKLHPFQQEVMDQLQHQIYSMNQRQELSYQKKLKKEKGKPVHEQKQIKPNLFSLPTRKARFVSYPFLDCLFKTMKQPDYCALSAQVNQAVLKSVYQNWSSFFQSMNDYQANPKKYTGKPRIPNYIKSHQKEAIFTNQVCVIQQEKWLKFPAAKHRLNIGKLGKGMGKLKQVRIHPRYGKYLVEIVLEVQSPLTEKVPTDHYMSMDLGVNNLATIITSKPGSRPVLVKGKVMKSINQYYNKKISFLKSQLRRGWEPDQGIPTSKRIQKLHQKRHLKIKDLFHKISYHIIQWAKQEEIGTIIIGQNKGWKKASNMGTRNNQQFCILPHQQFIQMIQYKANWVGIKVVITEESYTSKASFLDGDPIPTYEEGNEKIAFSGKRVKRGLYRSREGHLLNADVNGAYNILRKVVPNVFTDGIEGLVLRNAVSTPRVITA